MWRCLRLPRKANRFREIRAVGGPQPPPNQDSAHIERCSFEAFIQALIDLQGESFLTYGSHQKNFLSETFPPKRKFEANTLARSLDALFPVKYFDVIFLFL